MLYTHTLNTDQHTETVVLRFALSICVMWYAMLVCNIIIISAINRKVHTVAVVVIIILMFIGDREHIFLETSQCTQQCGSAENSGLWDVKIADFKDKPKIFLKKNVRNHTTSFIWFWQRSSLTKVSCISILQTRHFLSSISPLALTTVAKMIYVFIHWIVINLPTKSNTLTYSLMHPLKDDTDTQDSSLWHQLNAAVTGVLGKNFLSN